MFFQRTTADIEIVYIQLHALGKSGLVQIGGRILRETVANSQNFHSFSSLADAAPISGMVIATMGRK